MSRSSGKAARGECRGRAREEAEPITSEVGTPRLCSVARTFAVHHATVSWFACSAWLSIIGGRRSATGEHIVNSWSGPWGLSCRAGGSPGMPILDPVAEVHFINMASLKRTHKTDPHTPRCPHHTA